MALVTTFDPSSYTHRLYPQDDLYRVILAVKANGGGIIITFYSKYWS